MFYSRPVFLVLGLWMIFWLLGTINPVQGMATETDGLGPSNPGVLLNAEDLINQQLQKMDFQQVEQTVHKMNQEIGDYLPSLDWQQLLKDIRQGQVKWDLKTILVGVGRYFFREVVANSALLAQLVVLAVICAVLSHLQGAFNEGTIGKLAQAVCYLTLLTIALGSFALAVEVGREATTRMVNFIQALLPLLLTLMVALGGITSATILSPYITASLGIFSTLINYVVFPLIFLSAVLSIVNQLSDRFHVSRLAGLLRQASIWCLGLIMTLFIGVLSIQGAIGAIADGITLRAAKFATGTFVPVVGGAFADAIDAVIGYGLLLKNSIGILGLVILFGICIFPVLKILAITLAYKIASVLVQPLGDEGTAEVLHSLSGSMGLIMITVASVGLMFFMTVTILLGTSSLTIMLR
ncbi:MAG: stage III sporulation protein AE [Syntrophomonadaceae bacterium]|nr:stage III sporulation protein AE [Syntrophomonadaceae bacterium]